MRGKGIDYFENSRRATISQRQYAIDNPARFRDYGPNIWGLTAVDGPHDTTVVIDGISRQFHTYSARGAAAGEIRDDGTIGPTAAGGSVPFAPEIAIPALIEMRRSTLTICHELWVFGFLHRRFGSDQAASRKRRRGSGLVRIGYLGTTRADHRDDRELPDRVDLEDDAHEQVHRRWAEKSRLHRRLAGELIKPPVKRVKPKQLVGLDQRSATVE